MSLIKQIRKQTRHELLELNNRKLMVNLSLVAATLAEYANGSNWAYKDKQHIWIGEKNPEELAILVIRKVFGPNALSQIAKKVVGNG